MRIHNKFTHTHTNLKQSDQLNERDNSLIKTVTSVEGLIQNNNFKLVNSYECIYFNCMLAVPGVRGTMAKSGFTKLRPGIGDI